MACAPSPSRPTGAAFAEIRRIDLRSQDLPQLLQGIAELAEQTVPGAEEVSVTLVRGGQGTTPAHTRQLAVDCDETQYGKGDGDLPTLRSDMTARWLH